MFIGPFNPFVRTSERVFHISDSTVDIHKESKSQDFGKEDTLETTFLKAAAWLAKEAAMRAVHVNDNSFSEARPTPPMIGIKAAYTIGWSIS